MASGTYPSQPTAIVAPPKPEEVEAYIEGRLEQTRRQIKGVDLAAQVLAISAATLGCLLVATVLDQWILPDGLGFWGRMAFFVVLVCGLSYSILTGLVPLLVYRISPLFAAHAIEEVKPTLKNGLINFLLLRREPMPPAEESLARGVFQGLQQQTARELTGVRTEITVDRALVIRYGYTLTSLLLICGLYLALSPKNPLASFGRVFWPWADIDVPTRVGMTDIQPGSVVAFQGDRLEVSADVTGLRADEQVMLFYTTADKQSVDQAVPLTQPPGKLRYFCEMPPGDLGLQQDVTYYLTAGDARSRPFHVEVRTSLEIAAARVDYDYPEYTGLAHKTVEGVGDLRAIEGTKVTLQAAANQPIAKAWVSFDGKQDKPLLMKPEGDRATVDFRLMMAGEGAARPEHDSYQLHFTDRVPDGHQNPRPVRYSIDVIRDAPPRIAWVDPPPEKVKLPLNGSLELHVLAEDPDFGLRAVVLHAERKGRSLLIPSLLEKRSPEKAHAGAFKGSCQFQPIALNLEVGDKIVCYAEARDNREPAANRAETDRREFEIIDPDPKAKDLKEKGAQGSQRKPGQEDQSSGKGENSSEKKPGDENKSGRAEKQPLKKGEGQPNEPQDETSAPNDQQQAGDNQQSQPGNQGRQNKSKNSSRDKTQPQDQNSSEQGQSGGGGESGSQGGKQDQKQQGGGQQGDQQQGGSQQGDGQQGKGQQGGSQQSGSQQGGKAQKGNQQGDGSQGGQPQPGDSAESGNGPRQPIDGQTNPGEAFDEILKQRQQEDAQRQAQQKGSGQPQNGGSQKGDGQSGSQDPSKGQQPSGDGQQNNGQQNGQPNGQGTKSDGQKPTGAQQGGPQDAGEKSSEKAEGATSAGTEQGQKTDQGTGETSGQGTGKEKGEQAGKPNGGKEQGQDGSTRPDQGSQGGKGSGGPQKTGDNKMEPSKGEDAADGSPQGVPKEQPGDAGAGKKSDSGTGATEAQQNNAPREKHGGAGKPESASSDTGEKGSSPTNSPHQSDTQSDSGGDRSGGGQQGGGQPAKQSGTDTPGSSTSADEGAGKSNERGMGEVGDKGGDQAASNKQTGKPSPKGQKGPGSKQGPKSGDQQTAQQDQANQPSADSEPNQGKSDEPGGRSEKPSTTKSKSPSNGNPLAGGAPGQESGSGTDAEQPPSEAQGDDPNLEYARKQTDMALEYLEQQMAKDKPDQKLLDRLGWSREELEQFYRQWRKMKQEAGGMGPEAQHAQGELDDALKSLGLVPRSTTLDGSGMKSDRMTRLRDSRRFEPPREWADLYKAYSEGVGSGGK